MAIKTFAQGVGQWLGSAEVFSGDGRFLGNASEMRHVEAMVDGLVRIDLTFIGPFKHSGYYLIKDCGDHRLYQGPANIGYAETLSETLVDANAYWPALGLSQRFFLLVMPSGEMQLSLSLLSRGEHLIYVVVGQNDRIHENGTVPNTSLVSGTSFDLAADPAAGHGAVMLHRPGIWSGELNILDSERKSGGMQLYREKVIPQENGLRMQIEGGAFDRERRDFQLFSNGWHAWTRPDQPVAGSYSLSGGRALSGHFYHVDRQLHLWRREVVTHDGMYKAVVHYWYRGSQRIGVQYGVLQFRE